MIFHRNLVVFRLEKRNLIVSGIADIFIG